jgi:hypothetical protein
VKRIALCASTLLCAVAAAAAPAGAASECRGLQVCISVPGPWVVVPAQSGFERTPALYLLACPGGRGIVGGTDAEVSDRALDVSFSGQLGSPVAPGVTTSRSALFSALYAGRTRKATSFRPFLGCIPTSGGGGRSTTSVTFKPGHPVTLRARTVKLAPGRVQTVVRACPRGEHLVSSWHAVAFRTKTAPAATLLSVVTAKRSVANGRVMVRTTTTDALPDNVKAELQVGLACTRS